MMEMKWIRYSDGGDPAVQDDTPYGYAQGTSREVMKKICMNIRWNEQLDVHHNQLPAAVLVRLDHIWFINHAAVWV